MFTQLASGKESEQAAEGFLSALQEHYDDVQHRNGIDEVSYSLIDTSELTNFSKVLDSIATKLGGSAAMRKVLLERGPQRSGAHRRRYPLPELESPQEGRFARRYR